jgi:hypothetical protein
MPPTATGRHCATCAQTVVDFTLKTDAEILAHLARAAGGRTCGRFAAGQLERPLQRAAPAAPTGRWRAWVAAAVAVWGLRETLSETTKAQAAPQQLVKTGLPTAVHLLPAPPAPMAAPLVLRGVVVDEHHHGLPGVTVLLKGTVIGISTAADGMFELPVPAAQASVAFTLVVSSIGFVTDERVLAPGAVPTAMQIVLREDGQQISGIVVVPAIAPPAPWHPRRLYYWGKYWVLRPSRRS